MVIIEEEVFDATCIKNIRVGKGFTQQQLAERSGIRRQAIMRIESGKDSPNLATINKILNALGLKLFVK